jgi:cell division septal protein FtsQ
VTGIEPDREPEPPRAGRKWKVFALLLLVALIAPASWLVRLGASKLEFFHLRAVTVEGTRYLTPESILERLALDTMRSVWDDTAPLEDRLLLMSQVSGVEISRKLPGTLVVKIRENLPVALVPSPRGLEPVDTSGTVLPIDPSSEDLDLPVARQRDIGILTLLGRIRGGDARLYSRISTIGRDGRDAVVMQLDQSLRVRAPVGVSVSRLADIFPVESDLVRRRANVAELDLRYRDQVIARLQ